MEMGERLLLILDSLVFWVIDVKIVARHSGYFGVDADGVRQRNVFFFFFFVFFLSFWSIARTTILYCLSPPKSKPYRWWIVFIGEKELLWMIT